MVNEFALKVACSSHVYDPSDYEYSLVTELDIGTCADEDEDWPLHPVISRAALLGMAYASGGCILRQTGWSQIEFDKILGLHFLFNQF